MSMPSQVLAMASVEFFARRLAPEWKIDPAPYLHAVEEWRKSFASIFLPAGRTTPAWTVFEDDTLPTYPLPDYLCFPAWVDAPMERKEVASWVQEAARYLNDKGVLPVSPNVVEGTCGHSQGQS
jgi:hypothetical protein